MSAFEEIDYTCFETIITTTGKQLARVEQQFKRISVKDKLQALEPLNESKIARMTAIGYDLLYMAVALGDLRLVKKILAINKTLNLNHRYPQEEILAYVAAKFNYLPILSLLAEIKNEDGSYAVDLNLQGGGGYTPFYIASARGHVQMVAWLIGLRQSNGTPRIDFDKQTDNFQTPLIASILKGHPEILKLLIEAPRPEKQIRKLLNAKVIDDYSLVFLVVYTGRDDLLSILLDARDEQGEVLVDLNQPLYDGTTALAFAIHQETIAIVRMLLAAKMPDGQPRVNPNHLSVDNQTPVHLAAGKGNLEIIELLISAGADIRQSWEGILPWQLAAHSGHKEVADYLKQKTAAHTEALTTGIYRFFQRTSASFSRSAALLSGSSVLQLVADSSITLSEENKGHYQEPSNTALMISIGVSVFVLALLVYYLRKGMSETHASPALIPSPSP